MKRRMLMLMCVFATCTSMLVACAGTNTATSSEATTVDSSSQSSDENNLEEASISDEENEDTTLQENVAEEDPSELIRLKAEEVFPENQEQGLIYLTTAATMGNAQAAGQLGELYQLAFNGVMLESGKDYEKAMVWDTIAAYLGNPRGYTNLGALYYNGWGVDKDLNQAIEYFTLATENGDMKGPRYLGLTYEEKEDYENAAKYYQIAYDNGDITGGEKLANLYLNGLGVEKDEAKALEIYVTVVENANGNSVAAGCAQQAAYMYENGIGTDVDEEKAAEYYDIAEEMEESEH